MAHGVKGQAACFFNQPMGSVSSTGQKRLCSHYVLISCLPSPEMTKYSGFSSPLYHSDIRIQAR
jgi:hypothetical protein